MSSRTAFHLFGFSVEWYGLLIVLGILGGVALGMAREKRLGLPKDTSVDLALLGVPAAIVGARAYYVLFSWRDYAAQPFWKVFAVWEGGLAVYGGLLAALLAGAVYGRRRGVSFLKLADLAAPGFALGQCVGRWGNFINREAYGAAITSPRWQFFPAAVNIGGEWHAATFFYESAWCLLICLFLLLMERRGRLKRPGDAFLWYVLLYAMERAAVEGLRTDSLLLGPVRVSQLLSLLAALAATLILARRSRRTRALAAPAAMLAAGALLLSGRLAAGLPLEALALGLALNGVLRDGADAGL